MVQQQIVEMCLFLLLNSHIVYIVFTVSFNVILNFLFYASNFYLLYFHILCLNISYVKIYLTAADKTCAESSVKVRIVTFCPWRPSGPLAPAGP